MIRSDILYNWSLEEEGKFMVETRFKVILIKKYSKLIKVIKTQNLRKIANPNLGKKIPNKQKPNKKIP